MGFVGSAAMGLPMATGASARLPDQVMQRFETALDRGLDWGLDRGLGGEDCSAGKERRRTGSAARGKNHP